MESLGNMSLGRRTPEEEVQVIWLPAKSLSFTFHYDSKDAVNSINFNKWKSQVNYKNALKMQSNDSFISFQYRKENRVTVLTVFTCGEGTLEASIDTRSRGTWSLSPDTYFRLKNKNLTFLIVRASPALASGPNTEPHEFNYCNNTNVLSNRHMVGLLPSWALQSLLL